MGIEKINCDDFKELDLGENEKLFEFSSKSKPSLERNFEYPLEITSRDIKVIKFIVEMKFASLEMVFEKFFRKTRTEEEAASKAWAKKRLFQLQSSGFLVGVYAFSERTKFFSAGKKAYQVLRQILDPAANLKPSSGFDQKTFVHDRLLGELRVALEASGEVSDWLSDRLLRSNLQLTGGLTGRWVPDAIIVRNTGEKKALELEIAQKSLARYRQKISKYLSILRATSKERPFSKVLYLCEKENVVKILKTETRLYPDLFLVEPLSKYELLGKTNINNKNGN